MTSSESPAAVTSEQRVLDARARFRRRGSAAVGGALLALCAIPSIGYGVERTFHLSVSQQEVENMLLLGSGASGLIWGGSILVRNTKGLGVDAGRAFSPIGLTVRDIKVKRDALIEAAERSADAKAEAARQRSLARKKENEGLVSTAIALGAGALAGGSAVFAIAEAAKGRTGRAVLGGAVAAVGAMIAAGEGQVANALIEESAAATAAAEAADAVFAEQREIAASVTATYDSGLLRGIADVI